MELSEETLVFLFRDGKVFLAKKKRGFGQGKLNGYGGKKKEGEKLTSCANREVEEESTLFIKEDLFKPLGYVDFCFDGKAEWNKRVFIYRVDDFEGVPKETEEMTKAELFDFNKIPYENKEEMWEGDCKWLPSVIQNKSIKGEVHYTKEGKLVSWKDYNSGLNEIKLK